jgi:hypothetical protein
MPAPDPNESFHDRKVSLREFLLSSEWKRDARCKKWETYKLTIDGGTYRAQFNLYELTLDIWDATLGSRGKWVNQTSMRYQDINDSTDFDFIDSCEENLEQESYLDRIGCL